MVMVVARCSAAAPLPVGEIGAASGVTKSMASGAGAASEPRSLSISFEAREGRELQ